MIGAAIWIIAACTVVPIVLMILLAIGVIGTASSHKETIKRTGSIVLFIIVILVIYLRYDSST